MYVWAALSVERAHPFTKEGADEEEEEGRRCMVWYVYAVVWYTLCGCCEEWRVCL